MTGAFKDQREEQCGWNEMSRDEEEEVKTTKKEVAKTGKGPRVNEKR